MTTADNILLITTDQQRFDTIQAWGNRQIFTPHLNYLAAEGINLPGRMPTVPFACRLEPLL